MPHSRKGPLSPSFSRNRPCRATALDADPEPTWKAALLLVRFSLGGVARRGNPGRLQRAPGHCLATAQAVWPDYELRPGGGVFARDRSARLRLIRTW
jgi:hypothetical protein